MLPSPSNSSVTATLWGLGAAAILGLACLVGVFGLTWDRGPGTISLAGDSSAVILGRRAGSRNLPIALTTTESGKGLILRKSEIQAEDWPIVTYSMNVDDSLEPVFVWERVDSAGSAHQRVLPRDGRAVLLHEEPEWRGKIERIGLLVRPAPGVFGPEASAKVFTEARIALTKLSAGTAADVAWTRWTAFRGWSGRSINDLGHTWFPGLLVVWAVFGALAAGLLHSRNRSRAFGLALVTSLGTGWLLLHVLWLDQLSTQASETRERFEVSSFDKALERGQDHEVVEFAQRIKNELSRIDGTGRLALVSRERFFGERGRYLLLPYRTTHFRTTSALRSAVPQLKSGDGIVARKDEVSRVRQLLYRSDAVFQEVFSSEVGALYIIANGTQ